LGAERRSAGGVGWHIVTAEKELVDLVYMPLQDTDVLISGLQLILLVLLLLLLLLLVVAHVEEDAGKLRFGCSGATDDDVVDRDENELDNIANEAHDAKAHCAGDGDLLELLGVRLGAPLDQAARVHAELIGALDNIPHRVALVGEEWHGRQLPGHGLELPCESPKRTKPTKLVPEKDENTKAFLSFELEP